MADQTNSTAATEEAIRNRMMLYFNIQDKENIAESIKSSSKAFKAAKSIIKKILSSSDTKPADNTFFIDLCSELVKRCGAPIVMMFENSDFCRYFLSYHTLKKSKEIPNLLELCVQSIPSGAQKDTIPHICSLYKKITKAEPVFSNKGTKTKFLELFESIHQIFNYQKNRVQNEDSKKALRMMIKTLFKESDFKNPIFNSLERHLLKDYKEQLKATLEAIEVERQKEKKKKLMKEIVSSNPENLLYEHQLRNRKSFIEGEKLPFEENQENEYKEYSFPFNDILEKTLARTICSFLNRSGGRIYIGVTDNKIIKGLKLFRSQRAELHQTIKRCISTFEPDILGKKLVKEYFLPVVDNDMKPIPGLFIVKIVVKQGDPSCLYSTTRDMLQCYLRYQDQSKLLSAKETKEFIIERHLNPAQKLPDTFEDPEPDPIVDIEDGSLNESGHSMISMSSENYTSASEQSHLSLTISSNICSSFSQNSYVSMMSESAMQHSRENGIDHSLLQMEKDPASFSVSKSDTTKEESKATVDYGQNMLTGDDKTLTPLGTDYRSNLHILDDSFLKDSKGDILDDDKSTKNKKYPSETSNQKKQEGDSHQLSFEGNPNSKENSMLNSNSRSKNKKSAKAGSESKKASSKEGQKEYYSHLLNEFNNIQINGKNAVKVYEIFIDGLPITWTQDQFDKFVEGLKFKSIFSSRMFKKDTGLSNGRAFVNFSEREEAQKFVDLYHDSTEFGKALIAKFKEGS